MLVDTEGDRFEVLRVLTKERHRRVYRQDLTLSRIDRGDIRQQVPLRKDLSVFNPTPFRYFDTTSRATPDSVTQDVVDLWDWPT